MADLVSLAQRLNDVEIDNNAPVSSQTFRRIGSDVNYLLDYLGIANGETLAGPLDGLNVFSPPGTFSYSYTFTNSDLNVPKTLFTFLGGGERPLKYYRKSSNFESAPVSTGRVALAHQYPVLDLLGKLAAGDPSNILSPLFIVKCNSVEMGRVVSGTVVPFVGISTSIQYTREITLAPAGTNTITVTLVDSLTTPLPVSSTTTNYVAL